MILNRSEKEALWDLFQGGQANGEEMIDAVIAEVVRKLTAGASVEPYLTLQGKHKNGKLSDEVMRLYSAEQLAAARLQGRQDVAFDAPVLDAHGFKPPTPREFGEAITKRLNAKWQTKLDEAIAAARVQMNERCAKVCETPHHYFNDCKTNSECATAIRALLGKEQS